jgi:hypothetical protein
MESKICGIGLCTTNVIIIILSIYLVYLIFDFYESSDYCPIDILAKSGSRMIRNPVLREGRELILGKKTSVETNVDPLKDKISTENKKNLDRKKDELKILESFKATVY